MLDQCLHSPAVSSMSCLYLPVQKLMRDQSLYFSTESSTSDELFCFFADDSMRSQSLYLTPEKSMSDSCL